MCSTLEHVDAGTMFPAHDTFAWLITSNGANQKPRRFLPPMSKILEFCQIASGLARDPPTSVGLNCILYIPHRAYYSAVGVGYRQLPWTL